MNGVFDWCFHLNNLFLDIVSSIYESDLFLGVLSSIIATVVTLFCLWLLERYRNRIRFSKAEGEYRGAKTNSDGSISKASIKYEGGNRLTIKLTHDLEPNERTWKGLITMDNENYGTLGFQYTDKQREFGFKRCIITDDGEEMCLIPEDPKAGYGKEILIRKK